MDPAVDVEDLAGRHLEPVGEERDAGTSDWVGVVDVPSERGSCRPGVFERSEAGDLLGGHRSHRSGGDEVDADLVGAEVSREVAR